jgi:adenylyltransferase/sulfurtransferase
VVQLLAGAGVGRLGLVDPDVVEVSNLHRQTIHGECDAGRLKTGSAARFVARLNSQVRVEQHAIALDAANCLALVQQYDLVVEATDSLAAKYLCSDACVAARKPLVAGAAQGWEGQAALYVPGQRCYRCVFPAPLPAAERATCADNGVLGPVCHLVGSLQAILALQFIVDPARAASNALLVADLAPGQLGPTVRAVKLPPRKPSCRCASSASSASRSSASSASSAAPAPAPAPAPAATPAQREDMRDSAAFCEQHQLLTPACAPNRLRVPPHNNCSWDEALQLWAAHGANGCRIVDVREPVQFGIWALADAVNWPLQSLRDDGKRRACLAELLEPRGHGQHEPGPVRVLLLVCRRGVHSQDATLLLSEELATRPDAAVRLLNVQGGLEALARDFPGAYPRY